MPKGENVNPLSESTELKSLWRLQTMQGFNSGHFGSGLRRVICFGGAVLCVLLLAAQGFAQMDTGTILGSVFDPSGAVIPGATVVIVNEGTGQKMQLVTDSTGDFVTPALSAVAYYAVTVSKEGFDAVDRNHVRVDVSARVQLQFKLQPGRQIEAITVSGGAPIIDTASTTLGGIVNAQETEELPTNGRDVSQLMELVPGVNLQGGEGVVNGQTLFANGGDTILLLVDGADSSRVDCMCVDNTYGSSSNRMTRATVDDVEEFRFYDGTYPAEFGGLAGVMNVVTKSGTNQFHGDFFEFLRNERFDARNYFNPAPGFKAPLRLNQFGGTLGGPIKHDKLFFFMNYEGVRQRTGVSGISYVPTPAFLSTVSGPVLPYLQQLPAPNGPPAPGYPDAAEDLYQLPDVLTEDSAAVKMTYNLSPTKRLDVHWNMEHSLTESVFGVALGQTEPAYGLNQNAKLTFTDNITPTVLNTVFFAPNRSHIDPRAGLPSILSEPEISFGLTGFSGVGPSAFDLQVANNSFTWGDTLAWVKGRHQMKFGGEAIWNQDNKALQLIKFVSFGFPTLPETLQGLEENDVYSISTLFEPRAGARNKFLNFFAQDDFQASKKLTVNIGLRYQFDTAPYEAFHRAVNWNPATDTLNAKGTPLIDAPKTDFGPRLGLAYTPFESRKTVLRAGFGLYFAPLMAAEFQNFPVNTGTDNFGLSVYNFPAGSGPGGFYPLQGLPFPPLSYFSSTPSPATSAQAAQYNWHASYLKSWNATIQQELSPNTRLQIAYVGNHGEHLFGPAWNINEFSGYVATHGPFANFSSISYESPEDTENYDALQVSLTHRFSRRWSLTLNYTYSHCLDNEPALFSGYSYPSNPMLDYGNCDEDIRQSLIFNYIYAAPSVPHIPYAIGGGWQINGITTMRSGLPFEISCGCDPFEGLGGGLADSNIGVSRVASPYNLPYSTLNINAWYAPPTKTIGNSGRNQVFGPNDLNWDVGIMKHFKVRENQNIEFRAEMFNISNTPQFGNPNSNIASPVGFGEIYGTIGPAFTLSTGGFGTQRQVQFALKYNF
jgi:hypothetical protein